MKKLDKSILQQYLLKYAHLNSFDRQYVMTGASDLQLESDVHELAYHNKNFRKVLLNNKDLSDDEIKYIEGNTPSKKFIALLLSFILFICAIVYEYTKNPVSLGFSINNSTSMSTSALWSAAGISFFYIVAAIAGTCLALWLITLITKACKTKKGKFWVGFILLIVFIVLIAVGLNTLA